MRSGHGGPSAVAVGGAESEIDYAACFVAPAEAEFVFHDDYRKIARRCVGIFSGRTRFGWSRGDPASHRPEPAAGEVRQGGRATPAFNMGYAICRRPVQGICENLSETRLQAY